MRWMLLGIVFGCESKGVDPPLTCEPATKQVVRATTQDGIELEGDLWSPGQSGPAAILLHMTPSGGNDRSNYPDEFASMLVSRGIAVLNLDRRGVGTGDDELKRAAYLGPDGKLDAKAAYDFLVAHPCAFEASRIAVVGASNGTTTALDFTLFAESDAGTELPRALVFLTGGGYTENQFSIADQRAVLDRVPILFVYAENEAGWSEQIQSMSPPSIWTFLSYPVSGHGTRMFEAEPASLGAVSTWLDDELRR